VPGSSPTACAFSKSITRRYSEAPQTRHSTRLTVGEHSPSLHREILGCGHMNSLELVRQVTVCRQGISIVRGGRNHPGNFTWRSSSHHLLLPAYFCSGTFSHC
jgi:hypothetical protein